MSEKRYLRLCGLALIIIGLAGSALAIFTDFFTAVDGTAVFPFGAALGLIILIKLRPRANRK